MYPFCDSKGQILSFIPNNAPGSKEESKESTPDKVSSVENGLHYRIFPPFKLTLFERSEQAQFAEVGKLKGKSAKKMAATAARAHTRVPSNFRRERTFVHLCWIYMWCGTFK